MVGNRRPGRWDTKRRIVFSGGSSKFFRSALAALAFISSALSTMATRQPPSPAVVPKKLLSLRMTSTVSSVLRREVPFGRDGNYSEELIINRINADLANDLGNLAQRSLSMIGKNCEGMVPTPGAFDESDTAMLRQVDGLLESCREAMDKQRIHVALDAIWGVVAEANRYFAEAAPWALKKTDPERMGTVLYTTAEIIRQVAILAQPVMPEKCGQLLDLLSIPADERDFSSLGEAGRLPAGAELPKPEGVFPRYIREEPSDG
jgi:methionyl-tRNA synthetase